MIKQELLTDEQKHNVCRMYAKITLPPGDVVGYHDHIGDAESYFILSGTGIYNENGTEKRVTAGDHLYCPDGTGHGLANVGTEDLVFMALILYS